MQIKYQIKQSSIVGAGVGIFADEDIKKGDPVWRFYESDHIIFRSKEAYEQTLASMTMEEARDFVGHTYNTDNDTVLYETDDGRYMNHSETPNIIIAADQNDDYVASRDIKKGEECVINYLCSYYDVGPECWLNQFELKYNIWRPQNIDLIKPKVADGVLDKNVNLDLALDLEKEQQQKEKEKEKEKKDAVSQVQVQDQVQDQDEIEDGEDDQNMIKLGGKILNNAVAVLGVTCIVFLLILRKKRAKAK